MDIVLAMANVITSLDCERGIGLSPVKRKDVKRKKVLRSPLFPYVLRLYVLLADFTLLVLRPDRPHPEHLADQVVGVPRVGVDLPGPIEQVLGVGAALAQGDQHG